MPTWKPNGTGGYSLHGAPIEATLAKTGKHWVVIVGGKRVTLGKRASFDHADAVVLGLLRDDPDV